MEQESSVRSPASWRALQKLANAIDSLAERLARREKPLESVILNYRRIGRRTKESKPVVASLWPSPWVSRPHLPASSSRITFRSTAGLTTGELNTQPALLRVSNETLTTALSPTMRALRYRTIFPSASRRLRSRRGRSTLHAFASVVTFPIEVVLVALLLTVPFWAATLTESELILTLVLLMVLAAALL